MRPILIVLICLMSLSSCEDSTPLSKQEQKLEECSYSHNQKGICKQLIELDKKIESLRKLNKQILRELQGGYTDESTLLSDY